MRTTYKIYKCFLGLAEIRGRAKWNPKILTHNYIKIFAVFIWLTLVFTDAILIGYYEYKEDTVTAENSKAFSILNVLSRCVLLLSCDDLHMNPKILGPYIKF